MTTKQPTLADCAQLQTDAMTMALRLHGESDDSFAPETREVMARWRPRIEARLRGEESADEIIDVPPKPSVAGHLVAAASSSGAARDSLRSALRDCKAVEAIVILGLIKQASELENQISQLTSALKSSDANL